MFLVVGASQFFRSPGFAQAPEFVADLSRDPRDYDGSGPREFLPVEGGLLFAANGDLGSPVYRSDGTSVWPVPGVCEGSPGLDGDGIVGRLKDEVVIAAVCWSDSLTRLWVTPTAGGASTAVKIVDGEDSKVQLLRISAAAELDHGIAFVGLSYPHQDEGLWFLANGSRTARLILSEHAGDGTWYTFERLVGAGSRILVTMRGGLQRREVWISDGTAAGTERRYRTPLDGTRTSYDVWSVRRRLVFVDTGQDFHQVVVSIGAEDSNPQKLGASVDFEAIEPPHPYELWPPESDVLYFRSRTETYQEQIWSTDGTPEETRLIATLSDETSVHHDGSAIAEIDGSVYAILRESQIERSRLWRFSGPDQTAEVVAEVCDWGGDTYSCYLREPLTVLSGRLLFPRIVDSVSEESIWSLEPKTGSIESLGLLSRPLEGPLKFEMLDGREAALLSWPGEPSGTRDLWVTDGTAAGTRVVVDGFAGFAIDGRQAIDLPFGVLISADDGLRGYEPWLVDLESGGARILADLRFDVSSSRFEAAAAFGDSLYLGTVDRWTDMHVSYLSGAPGAVDPLFEIEGEDCGIVCVSWAWSAAQVAGRVVLGPRDEGAEVHDPTTGTLTRVFPDGAPAPGHVDVFEARDEGLYVSFEDHDTATEALFGGVPGAGPLYRLLTVPTDLPGSSFSWVERLDKAVVLTVEQPGGTLSLVGAPFDGVGASVLAEGLPELEFVYRLGSGVVVGGRVGSNAAFWFTDGSPEGTRKFATLPVYRILYGRAVGSLLYFVATTSGERQWWVTDGTSIGTRLVTTVPGLGDVGYEVFVDAAIGEIALVATNVSASAATLFRLGPAGELETVFEGIDPDNGFTPVPTTGSLVFYTAYEVSEVPLWITDGTPIGTRPFASGYVATAVNDRVLVWRYSPKSKRTELRGLSVSGESDELLFASAEGEYFSIICPLPEVIFAARKDAAHGVELWSTDGTSAGTRLVSDLREGPDSSYPEAIAATDRYFYFAATDDVYGRELWRVARAGPEPCIPDARTLCLSDGRFRAFGLWAGFAGEQDDALPRSFDDSLGFFGLTTLADTDLAVRVRPSEAANGAYDLELASMTNARFALTVIDTATGSIRRYLNELGQYASLRDPEAFPGASASAGGAMGRTSGEVRASRAWPLTAVESGLCLQSESVACVLGGRFAVSSSRSAPSGSELARVVVLSDGSVGFVWDEQQGLGAFAKMVDGGSFNGHAWAFGASLESFEFDIRIVDTLTGVERTYRNPEGSLLSFGDIEAF